MIAKVTRAVGWGIGILFGLILILFLTLMAITDEQYKEWITSAVESSTGRDFLMEDFSLDLGSSLSASARGVQLGNAEWSDQGNMLSVGNFEFDISLWRLLAGVADVRLVTADAEVLVETSDSGESNWAMGTPGDEAEEEPPAVEAESDETGGIPIQPLLREIRLENIVVTMSQPDADPRTAELNQLLIETIEEPDANTTISLSAAVEQVPIELSGDLGDVDAVLSGAETPLSISGNIDENTLGISGNWGPVYPEMNMDLSVDLDVPSTSKLMALANLSDVEMGQLNLEFDLLNF